jgi:hypothetical protein
MATNTDTQPPLRVPNGSSYGTPADRPVHIDDCKRFEIFLAAVETAKGAIVEGDPATTAAQLHQPLTDHFFDYDYVLATAQPAVWHDALAVINWLYALGTGKAANAAAADQALANVRSWHTTNCSSITTS